MDRNKRNKRIVDFNIMQDTNKKDLGYFDVDPIYDEPYDETIYLNTFSIPEHDKYVLIRTCYACPEQYDVYDADDKNRENIRAYLRLRHGRFTVTCPDVGGDVVYRSEPEGDGIFMDFERDRELENAIRAVEAYYSVPMITHVAIMLNGMVFSLPRPNGHHNIIYALAALGVPTPIRGIQGFKDSKDRFLTRTEAFEVAIASKQIERPEHGLEELYSEDLW